MSAARALDLDEIVAEVTHCLRLDRGSLANCARVNHMWFDLAIAHLWRDVGLCIQGRTVDGRERPWGPQCPQLPPTCRNMAFNIQPGPRAQAYANQARSMTLWMKANDQTYLQLSDISTLTRNLQWPKLSRLTIYLLKKVLYRGSSFRMSLEEDEVAVYRHLLQSPNLRVLRLREASKFSPD
jgi:hypothetical protein